jgi:hypothetical protein
MVNVRSLARFELHSHLIRRRVVFVSLAMPVRKTAIAEGVAQIPDRKSVPSDLGYRLVS